MPTEPEEIDLSEHELREITGYAAACASRVLSVFELRAAADTRPREAVDAAWAFAGGGRRTGALRTCAWAAYRAAREAGSPAAGDAARAASHAAAAAYLHPRASAHQVKHILGAAAHAARAEELASEGSSKEGAVSPEGPSGEWAVSAQGPVLEGSPGSAPGTLAWARRNAPPAVMAVLGRLPAAPPGGGRVGELIRALDTALRA
ncbi:putative immunity protein [Streptomyces fructofermentans]|uniref:putative immunity protein n=1 Tax=Streptomyces fructofermentans TaxID=152141 RepID=UPI0033C89576